MKRICLIIIAAFLFAGASQSHAAQSALEVLKEVKVNGFASFGYNYNFNEPFSRAINFRPFNPDDRSFNLEVAELVFEREASDAGSVGFRADLNYGYTVPAAIHSTGFSGSDDFDLQQAYIRYIAPVGSGLTIDFGKFITEMGAEVIEGYDGWNYNYSRSLLFYYTIPFTHTGVRAVYAVNERLTLTGMIANGWDNVRDNNGSKTLLLHAAIAAMENSTLNLKYIVGAEQDDNNSNLRQVFNVNFTTALTDQLELNLDFVYGKEDSVPGTGDSTWSGIAGILRYRINEKLAFNLRGEIFSDDDGARTGTVQDMWEITVTPEYAVSDNLLVRAEYRHDNSDREVFDKKATASVKQQDTLGVNVIFYF